MKGVLEVAWRGMHRVRGAYLEWLIRDITTYLRYTSNLVCSFTAVSMALFWHSSLPKEPSWLTIAGLASRLTKILYPFNVDFSRWTLFASRNFASIVYKTTFINPKRRCFHDLYVVTILFFFLHPILFPLTISYPLPRVRACPVPHSGVSPSTSS